MEGCGIPSWAQKTKTRRGWGTRHWYNITRSETRLVQGNRRLPHGRRRLQSSLFAVQPESRALKISAESIVHIQSLQLQPREHAPFLHGVNERKHHRLAPVVVHCLRG